MGGLANSVFNLLLGWVRGLIDGVWKLINTPSASNGLRWIGDHWLLLVAILAVGGIVMDFFVWMIRWRPYYVWRSSMARLKRFFRGRGKADDMEDAAPPATMPRQRPRQQQQPYTPPATEAVYDPWQEPTSYSQDPALAQTLFGRPQDYDDTQQWTEEPGQQQALQYAQSMPAFQAYETAPMQEEYYGDEQVPYTQEYSSVHPGLAPEVLQAQLGWTNPPQGQADDFYEEAEPFPIYTTPPQPEAARSGRVGRMRQESQQGTLKQMRRGLSRVAQTARNVQDALGLASDEDDQIIPTYTAPPLPKEKRHAFHMPVYPDNWQAPSNSGANNPDYREDD